MCPSCPSKPPDFVPGYHGIDHIYENAGKLVIVESKGGTGDLAKGQMSRKWIDHKINELAKSHDLDSVRLAERLRVARDSGNLQGMVVKTKIDGNNMVADPEFELKDWSQIGEADF